MSTAAGAPSNGATSPENKHKGKGKSAVASDDVVMEEEDDDDDDDDDSVGSDEEMEEDDEDEDDHQEIDPSAILGRRTRGVKVDYTSKEALDKAGLKADDDDDEEVEAK